MRIPIRLLAEPVAERIFDHRHPDGTVGQFRITVGHPYFGPDDRWYCEVDSDAPGGPWHNGFGLPATPCTDAFEMLDIALMLADSWMTIFRQRLSPNVAWHGNTLLRLPDYGIIDVEYTAAHRDRSTEESQSWPPDEATQQRVLALSRMPLPDGIVAQRILDIQQNDGSTAIASVALTYPAFEPGKGWRCDVIVDAPGHTRTRTVRCENHRLADAFELLKVAKLCLRAEFDDLKTRYGAAITWHGSRHLRLPMPGFVWAMDGTPPPTPDTAD